MRSYLPVHVGGALDQCGAFATSNGNDIFIPNPAFDAASPNPQSIYCIHGTADRNHAFKKIVDHLNKSLTPHIKGTYLLSFNKRFTGASIEDFALQLLLRINKHGDKHVILMGHSRGGLVASWFTENLAGANHITVCAVFAFCAPCKGSHLAKVPLLGRLSDSVNEMQPQTEFLTTLTEKIIASDVPYFFLGAGKDHIVWYDCWHPYAADAQLPNLLHMPKEGHLSILNCPEVLPWVEIHLNTILPVAAEATLVNGV